MNIAIIGAGNLGTAIAADLGRNHEVKIYSSRPESFGKSLQYIDEVTKVIHFGNVALVSNDYKEVVFDAELIFICLPTFLIKETVEKLIPFLQKDVKVGFVPGAGGIEYLSKELVDRKVPIFGFERVPYISRVRDYGKSVCASKKQHYRIATIPSAEAISLAGVISELFEVPCDAMSQFISISLTPTLHTSRLYDLYKDYKEGDLLDVNPYFYGEWRDSASEICLELDSELHKVASSLEQKGIPTSELVPYSIHYESETPELLTHKLCSISSLSSIKGPLIETTKGKYVVDLNSRYFTESFPYRLALVKGLADICQISIPKTDEVLTWYSQLAGKEYYMDGEFTGVDSYECNIPRNYGIQTLTDLRDFYQA
ncbi:NAD/NADP octopine/nopaline dehydrogenase family protein [Streptococcus ovis]|uniref:NAD/NADP octopine/nopaline dehydrogenase family protein n=1 Tax=Streptococcus ovis TaxID=82806 RepID=UPI00036A82E6|nr:NAD/NADP octopine/nopaline dehydrogenase family protein [Streptococcus ovis]